MNKNGIHTLDKYIMKRNILITFLYKEGAGPIFTIEMAKGLAMNGCNIYVVVSSKISNRKDWENENLFKKVVFIETGSRKNAISATINWFVSGRKKLRQSLKDIHFDMVISTFYHPWAISVLNCARCKNKYVICHDPIHHSGVPLYEKVLTTSYIKAANKVIVLTKSFIPLVNKRFGFNKDLIIFMPHGRMSSYQRNEKETKSNKDYNFLFFGRIGEYKGLNILAKAYKKLSYKRNDISLRVAGSGDFSKYADDFHNLKNCTIDNRYIKDEEVSAFFSYPNTILVLPYIDASQSGVIPIAFEHNVPIIASDTGGLREQLDEGHLGLLCKANNVDSLCNAMNEICNNESLRNSYKTLMTQHLEHLNWNNVTKVLLKNS